MNEYQENSNQKLDPAILKLGFILVVGALAPLFDTTIINVAIDTLGHELHTSVATVQWVITGYLLALGIVIPITGWAVERFGGKRMWMWALFIFLIGSVLSGLSWNVGSLIAFRVVQGIGGGLILPIMQTLLFQAADGQKLGRLMALISLPVLLGPILGPVVGGIVVENLNWQWIFYINIPICLIALGLAWRGLPSDKPVRTKIRFDITGFGLLTLAIVSLIYGISQVGTYLNFANALVIASLAIGVVSLIIFIFYTLKRTTRPIIDLRVFQISSFSASAGLLFLSGLSIYGPMMLLPLYYQQVAGVSVLVSGLLLIPIGIGELLVRVWAGKLTDTLGGRFVIFMGITFTAIGTLPFALAGPHTSFIWLSVALIVRGIGLSAVNISVLATAYQDLHQELISHASSTTQIIQQIGGAFGTAVLAVILQNQFTQSTMSIAEKSNAFNHTFWWSLA